MPPLSAEGVRPEYREALQAVLRWPGWNRTPKQAELLQFVGEHALSGKANELKESTIAIAVFGRDVSFDQTRDSVVRVQMHRLRKKLEEYYEGEGASQPVQIRIPVGQYVPSFVKVNGHAAEAPASVSAPTAVRAPRHRLLYVLSAVGLLAAIGIGYWRLRTPEKNRALSGPATSVASSLHPVPAAPAGDEVRILCGGVKRSYTDRAGRVWTGDRFVTGGGIDGPSLGLFNRVPDYSLLESCHNGDFEYRIPARPGWYELKLYFFDRLSVDDPSGGGRENERVFSVDLNGGKLLSYFDPNSDRGRQYFSVRAFRNVTPGPDGFVTLRFRSDTGLAFVNAIELTPGVRDHTNPIRLVMRNSAYTGSDGRIWMPDNFYVGGVLATYRVMVRDTPDPELYSTERYGNFQYAIPVPPGSYTVNLHFAEHWWGPGTPGGPDGARIFNVFCDGRTLLRNFNLVQEAGPLRAVVRTFKHLRPNAGGKIALDFDPVENYPAVHAIEVLDEGP